ncbi:MAG: ATP-binding protein [Promicromonosporaceae bacterium]|nr:ATP-binding protein [Promicromonosporaceae bacterium]
MTEDFLPRNSAALAAETLSDTPVTVITGARQVGKSTLMQQLVRDRPARVISLDIETDRDAAERDPDGFAGQFPQGILAIDEIQRVPKLLMALKASVDSDRRPGRFLVTGSADLLSLRGAQESLAGRAQTIPLEGLSRGELAERVEDFAAFAWNLPNLPVIPDCPGYTRRDYLEMTTSPAFPELRSASARTRSRWLDNYADRVLSRDTADISGIAYPDRLAPLLTLISGRNCGEFVAARVAREVDIPERSLPTYLKALRSVYLVRVIPGWFNNVADRAVSTSKVAVADTGLAAHLAEVHVDGLERNVSSTLTGGFVEGFVVGELAKQQTWSAKTYSISHYRDNHGREVDLVLENRSREVVGVEVKATTSVRSGDFRGLTHLRDRLGERFVAGVVLHTGARAVPFGDRLWALPLAALWEY